MAVEVQRRLQLRKEATAAEEHARRIIRDHESREKVSSDSELAAARAVVRDAEERRAKDKPQALPKDGAVELTLPDADMASVVSAWLVSFGTRIGVGESVRS